MYESVRPSPGAYDVFAKASNQLGSIDAYEVKLVVGATLPRGRINKPAGWLPEPLHDSHREPDADGTVRRSDPCQLVWTASKFRGKLRPRKPTLASPLI